MFEEDLLCLLDFYVRDNVQRKGLGFALFDSALKVRTVHTNKTPRVVRVRKEADTLVVNLKFVVVAVVVVVVVVFLPLFLPRAVHT